MNLNSLQKTIQYSLMSTLLLLMIGCKERNDGDLTSYVAETKKQVFSAPETKNIANIKIPKPVAYQSANLRSPFASRVSAPSLSPTAKDIAPINEFSVNALRFVGTVQKGNKIWAIIVTPTNKLYQMTIGDYIGSQYAKITYIYRDHIELLETGTEDKKPIQRRIILRLKEEK